MCHINARCSRDFHQLHKINRGCAYEYLPLEKRGIVVRVRLETRARADFAPAASDGLRYCNRKARLRLANNTKRNITVT